MGEWKNKLWCIQTLKYYSRAKRKNYSIHTTWMEPKDVMLTEKKKLISKGVIVCDSIYVTCSKWQNDSDGEQVGGCEGEG